MNLKSINNLSSLKTMNKHLNGLVRFAERRNLVTALVPSHFKRSLHPRMMQQIYSHLCLVPPLKSVCLGAVYYILLGYTICLAAEGQFLSSILLYDFSCCCPTYVQRYCSY